MTGLEPMVARPQTFVTVPQPAIPPAVKTAVIFGAGGALVGGLLFGAKGAVVIGVGAPVALFVLVAYALKGFQ